jgi:hypothetical protein
MILHVVLFRPRPNVTDAERQQMLDAIREATTGIAAVRQFHIGKRVTHGAAYESMSSDDFPYAAVVELEDLNGLRSYLQHHNHQRLGTLFYELLEAALVYDYEVIDGTKPDKLNTL